MDVLSVEAPSCCTTHQQLSCDELEIHITELAAHIHAATYRLLVLIAEFDRREGWGGEGVRSMAHWLNWKCGIGLNAAREKVLEAAREQMGTSRSAEDVSAETPGPIGAQRADALVGMAETLLAHGPTPCAGGERHQLVLHVSAETLCEDGEAGRCAIEGGPAIAAETARRLGCDASRVVVTLDEQGEALSIGRRSRTVPPAIRRALRLRDHGCRFPGCTQHRCVDAHHIQHWADGGETNLANLVLLCRHHHRLVHEGGFSVGRGINRGPLFAAEADYRFYQACLAVAGSRLVWPFTAAS